MAEDVTARVLADNFKTQEDILREIYISLEDFKSVSQNMSQSAAKDAKRDTQSNKWAAPNRRTKNKSTWSNNTTNVNFNKQLDNMADSFEDAFKDALFGSSFKNNLSKSLAGFANEIGLDLNDAGNEVGKMIGRSVGAWAKDTAFGKRLSKEVNYWQDKAQSSLQSSLSNMASNIKDAGGLDKVKMSDLFKQNGQNAAEAAQDVAEGASNVIDFASKLPIDKLGSFGEVAEGAISGLEGVASSGAASAAATAAASEATAGATAAMTGISGAVPIAGAAIVAAAIAIDKLSEAVGPAISGISELGKSAKAAMNKRAALEGDYAKLARKRLEADANTLIQLSYDIIQQSAEKVVSVFQASLNKITSTQGYTKADVQDLMANYASRLKAEGLSSVVSAADITDNLTRILDQGLSGPVAEEFAYIATKLNSAVPTEDFFSYASTYASVAANAIAEGKSQSEALQIANKQIEEFANNLLYAGRQLAGGFSSGLKNASTLFEDAVKIANTAKSGNAGQLSGVLTSVSAIVGAIAPDVASGLVDAVVSAATGGNSSNITALRSLSGVGASNTAFLKAFAEDPQAIFTNLFNNLAKLQKMSNDNFMEVAEGLSEVFGISADAFARMDFNYLAKSIASMDTTSKSLAENVALLKSGETTTTAEQQRMAQINEYILNEGLSYVLDNEAAMQIQQHMWDEQLAREMQEAEYAVNLQGSALEALQGIATTVENIINILNPLYWGKSIASLVATAVESKAMTADVKQVLQLGNVGRQNAKTLYNLTTVNKDLQLEKSYVELMGGTSAYGAAKGMYNLTQANWASPSYWISKGVSAVASAYNGMTHNPTPTYGVSSKYNWGMVGKSALSRNGLTGQYNSGTAYATPMATSTTQSAINIVAQEKMQKYLNDIAKYDDYSTWSRDAKKYGISNLSRALEDYGLTENDIKGKFQEQAVQKANEYSAKRREVEDQFWENANKWYEEQWPDFDSRLDAHLVEVERLVGEVIHGDIQYAAKGIYGYWKDWQDYYLRQITYNNSLSKDFITTLNAEKAKSDNDALALANALTGSIGSLADPTAQTNVLLAAILKVTEAIMQQNNSTATVSLPTALSSLGLGLTK